MWRRTASWLLLSVLLATALPALAGDKPIPAPTTWWPDATTNLIWSGSPAACPATHQQALEACAGLTIGAYTGWRLPTEEASRTVCLNGSLPPYHTCMSLPSKAALALCLCAVTATFAETASPRLAPGVATLTERQNTQASQD